MSDIVKVVKYELTRMKVVRFSLVCSADFEKEDESGKVIDSMTGTFRGASEIIYKQHTAKVNSPINRMLRDISQNMEELNAEGSNWQFRRFSSLFLEFGKCKFLAGGNGLAKEIDDYIKDIPNSHHLSNLCGYTSVDCFFYALVLGLHWPKPVPNRNIEPLVEALKNIDPKVKSPVTLKGVEQFESKCSNLRLNVFMYERDNHVVYPVYVSSKKINSREEKIAASSMKTVNLLILRIDHLIDADNVEHDMKVRLKKLSKQPIYHYICINDLGGFIRKTYNSHSQEQKPHICENCLFRFKNSRSLYRHQELCLKTQPQKVIMPEIDDKITFRAVKKQTFIPFTGYLDFEASMNPISQKCVKCKKRGVYDIDCPHTLLRHAEQKPMMYHLLFVDNDMRIIFRANCSGDDRTVMRHFYGELEKAANVLDEHLRNVMEIRMSDVEKSAFQQATECWICNKKYTRKCVRVRDHDHYTGDYLGSAHRLCNLRRRVQYQNIPIYCHNLSAYDMHFIISHLSATTFKNVSAMPFNTEKLRTLTLDSFKFLDSIHFLNGSLAAMVNNLDPKHPFDLLKNANIYEDEEGKQLLLQKGVFPYEWTESAEFLRSQTELPSIDKFYSSLTMDTISPESYRHAQNVWTKFKCRNMLEYCDLYCYLDVLLLAECFQAFRKIIYQDYALDVAHYISLPQLAFDAMLKMTEVVIQPICDIDQYNLVQQNIRGGVSFINTRYVKGQMEPDQPGIHILDIDVNNLYGKAQCFPMPVGDYEWVDEKTLKGIDWLEQTDDQEYGYIVEVDLVYPPHLHTRHASLPLAPVNMTLRSEHLSQYSLDCLETFGHRKDRFSSQKLVGHFLPRKNYTCHYMNLKTYLELGMQLTRVHRAIGFRQEPFLKKYVESTCAKRAAARTSFEKNVQKLMNNAVYGKTIQNDRKFLHVSLCRDEEQVRRRLGHPLFSNFKIINENLVSIFSRYGTVKLNKCYAVGFTILERSKDWVYRQYYYHILDQLGGPGNCQVAFSDTDSLCLYIRTRNRHDALRLISDVMDFSNYPRDHPLYDDSKKMQLGFWKDEMGGRYVIVGFVGVRSKSYSFLRMELTTDTRGRVAVKDLRAVTTDNTCKGVVKVSRQQQLTFDSYLETIREKQRVRVNMNVIQVKDHRIYTATTNKQCFSSFDDKRFILPCGVHSVPHGSSRTTCLLPGCPNSILPPKGI